MTRIKYATDIKRFTGYRIQFTDPQAQGYLWQQFQNQMVPFLPVLEMAAKEPYWLDDTLRHLSPADLLNHGMRSGEFFAGFFQGKLVCITTIRDIFTNHSGYFEGWSHPDFRNFAGRRIVAQIAHEIIDYAFAPFGPEGLGLKKLKAEIAASNRPAVCAVRALKFQLFGGSPADALHHGQYYDTLHLELLNPAFFQAVEQGTSIGHVKEIQDTSTASLSSSGSVSGSGSVCSATGPELDNSSSSVTETGDDLGAGNGVDASPVVAAKPRSKQSSKPRTVRGELRPVVQPASTRKNRK